ncbi:MAG: HIT domain-containing protein [Anaerolineales bacterium]
MLHSFAKTDAGGKALGWFVDHVSSLLPLKRVHETNSLIAFFHPRPLYPIHVLILPKRKYRSVLDIPPEDEELIQDLISTIKVCVSDLNLEQRSYRFILNGGKAQDVPLLHFHLIGENDE